LFVPLSIRADTGLRLCAARYARVTQAGKEPPTGNIEPEIEFHCGSVWHAAKLSAPILGFDQARRIGDHSNQQGE
jgi:hypothetical protein